MSKILAYAAVLAAFLLGGCECYAGPFRVYNLGLTYQKVINNYDPMLADIPTKEWGDHVALSTGIDVYDFIFWDSTFHYESAYHKVMAVGWQFDAGMHLGPYLDAIYSHHSRHSADRMNSSNSINKYPLQDFVGARINFVTEPRRR